MLTSAALGFVNHLLDGEDWARARLCPFAGQTAKLLCGPLEIWLTITDQGLFVSSTRDSEAAVTLTLPPDTPWRALSDRSAVLAAAQVSGSAELAQCLAFVLRNLRWDIEDDLARVVGDIPARRIVQTGQTLIDWQLKAARNLAHNLAEYFSRETPVLTADSDFNTFRTDVDAVTQATERLEERIALLSKQSPSRP